MEGIPKGKKGFETKIYELQKGNFYVLYNPKRKICILNDDALRHLSVIKESLPKDTYLWYGLAIVDKDFEKKLKLLIHNKFSNPYVCITDPMYSPIKPSLALSTDREKSEGINFTLNATLQVLEQYQKDSKSCYLSAKLTDRAVKVLKNASLEKPTKGSQKELTGELVVKDVENINHTLVYIIDIDEGSIHSGEDEDVRVSNTRYNFHSHPEEAYIRHSVKKAWPSQTDYLGYYKLGENTIFHCVATLEGLYIMSFGSYWNSRLKEISTDFILETYDIDHTEYYTPHQYVKKVNSILYKGYPIYKLYFFPWSKANTIFKVFFPQIGSSCLVSQKISRAHKLFHE